jgi:hypothetical protein
MICVHLAKLLFAHGGAKVYALSAEASGRCYEVPGGRFHGWGRTLRAFLVTPPEDQSPCQSGGKSRPGRRRWRGFKFYPL